MKYLPIFLFVLLCVGLFVYGGNNQEINYDYLRVHIRANSNLECDQQIKYIIKDEVVDFVTPYLVGCDSKSKSIAMISGLLQEIESVCNSVLEDNGFAYKSKAGINQEHFPTRMYDNIVLEEGVYDALIINLGDGVGDNWWCVVYPPLCFVNKSNTSVQNIQYQSYLVDIIKKYFN